MQCDRVRVLMDRYVSEELPPGDRASLEAHLGSCQNCQQQITDLRRLVTTLQCEPAPPVPEKFVDRLMARARKELQASRPSSAVRRAFQARWIDINAAQLANAIAAVAVGILIGFVLGQQTWEHTSRGNDPPTAHRDAELVDSLDYFFGYSGTSVTQTYLNLTQ